MRKLFNIFLFVLCIVAIAGCNDTESSESKLEIKAVNTNFQATGRKRIHTTSVNRKYNSRC